MTKTRVLFLLGGYSGEHEISLISGKHILVALDRKKFEPIILVIQKNRVMTLASEEEIAKLPNNPKKIKTPAGIPVTWRPYHLENQKPALLADGRSYEFDVAFPVLHGPGGEDGSIQGFFEVSRIPVVGADVKASAISMDKGVTKRLCSQAHIEVADFVELYRGDGEAASHASALARRFGFPLFVKPARLGSSLGVTKVHKESELKAALDLAFSMDQKILVEKGISGREIEIAVLGNRNPLTVSPAGEIRCVKAEFYSYDAKYVEEDAAELIIPASLSSSELARLQEISRKIFQTLECRGMARIDYFMTEDGKFLLNEVNTIPGFTPISMYPKLMQLTGISYSELITRLLELAVEP